MKIIFLILAIYVHAFVVLGATTTEKHRSFEHVISDKCLENSHSKYAYENLKEATAEYERCQTKVLLDGRIPHPVEQHDEFCKYFEESHYYSCLQNLSNSALPCLDKSEKFFPSMILKAYNTTFATLCGKNGLRKTEYFLNKLQKNDECISEAKMTMAYTGRCIENLTAYKNFMQITVDLNQRDYCSDMESFINCAIKLVQQQCHENFSIIKYYASELFLSVCKKSQDVVGLTRFG